MPAQSLPIQERFVSIQGEGLWVGSPSTFVRVAGCNLRCAWCDSPRTSWDPQSEVMSLAELEAFCKTGPRDVVLTGGEPMLFSAMATLSERLSAQGHRITVETAGTVWLDGVHVDLVSLSPKLSHSTPKLAPWARRHERRRWQPAIVRRWMARPWQLKFVVRAHAIERDLAEIDAMLAELDVTEPARVLLMPECTDPATLGAAYQALLPHCIDRGFTLGQRLHIALFGHTPMT